MNTHTTPSLARALTVCVALAVLSAGHAQPAATPKPGATPAGGQPVKLEAFSVTGTFVKRLDQEKALPVTVISDEDIKVRGVATAAELFATIPQAGRIPISESQASGADARGDIATVSLRGLGSSNTLVLLNGRRFAPHPISMPEGTLGVPSMATNINVLPTAAIARVEVLRDGASALYGTDATAGVINTILRRDYAGLDLTARYADTEEGGGREYRITAASGHTFNRGRTSLVFSYDYFDREALRNSDRDFSRNADFRTRAPYPWNGTTTDLSADLRSDRGFYGRFQRGTVNPNGTITGSRPAGVTAGEVATNGTFYFVPTAPAAPTRALQATEPNRALGSPVGEYYMNVNEFRYLLPATQRHNFYTSLDHKLGDAVTLFSDLTYYRADSHNQREASRVDSTADNNIVVTAANPYNPFGTRFYSPTGAPNADGTPRLTGTPSDVVLTRVTLPEFGARQIDVRSESWRALAGLRGTLANGWTWETAGLYSFAETTDLESSAIKESQLRDALAGTTAATALNPFMTTFTVANGALVTNGARFTNPDSVVAPLRGTFYRRGETSLGSWDFRVNGDLARLPAGPLGLAFGGEWRGETYLDFRDVESGRLSAADVARLGLRPQLVNDNNYIQVSPSDNTDASRRVLGVFAELVAPLYRSTDRSTGFQSLELSGAVRLDDYDDFGSTTKPKVGISARALPWLMLRGSYNQSFLAPNLAALYAGAVQRSITGVNDAYRFNVTNSSDDGTTARRVSLRSGNKSLQPEEAETYTAGVVIEPPGFKGLSFGIDWWMLEQTNAITRLDAGNIIAEDSALLTAANAAALNQPVDQVDLSKAGSPNIIRNPVTQQDRDTFAAYNAGKPRAQQRATVGTIRYVGESYLNASSRELAGVDFFVSYNSPKTRYGTFRATVEASHLQTFDEQLSSTAPATEYAWRDGNTRWKGSFALNWKNGDWAAGLFTEYVGNTQDSAIRTTLTGQSVSSNGFLIVGDTMLTNLNVTRFFRGDGWWGKSSIRFGVNNVFNEEPPFSSSESDGYLRGFGNPRGRVWSIELTKHF